MENVQNQVIVSDKGHSWLGFHTNTDKFTNALKVILELSKEERYKSGKYANYFWVLDFDGGCVAAQATLKGALKYYHANPERVLVHYQSLFV